MPSLKDFYTNLRAALLADTELNTTWANTHFGKSVTVLGGIDAGPVKESEYPGILIEHDPAIPTVEILGGTKMRVTTSLWAAVVWKATDNATLFTQRLELVDILIRVVMRNRKMGGAVEQAFVTEARWMDVEEPLAMLSAKVTAQYVVSI